MTGAPTGGAPLTAETVAFIDIGTNSVRLMVVRLEPDHSWIGPHHAEGDGAARRG